ncbi:hypothetical protein D3C75_613760 [compost metagenome]
MIINPPLQLLELELVGASAEIDISDLEPIDQLTFLRSGEPVSCADTEHDVTGLTNHPPCFVKTRSLHGFKAKFDGLAGRQ